jgi:diaminopimelate decarboxylase
MELTNETGLSRLESGMECWSAGLDFHAVAETFGTPTYIFNAPRLRDNLDCYLRFVTQADRVFYPVKANPSFAVLRRLADFGCGMDCASRDEVDAALMAGVPCRRLSYNTPAPEFGLIRNLLRSGATVVVDSEGLLARISSKIPAAQMNGSLALRVNLDAVGDYRQQFDWKEMVNHGSKTGKFGIPAERIVEVLKGCVLPVVGLHVHVGTMMDNLTTFENVIGVLHRLMDDIHAQTEHRIAVLNLGGGLGIRFVPGQSFPSVDWFADHLASLKRQGVAYCVEPGQSLVGDTMGLLTRVVAIKEMRGRRWAILDVGSDQLMKITTLSWRHQLLDQRHAPLPLEGPDSVGGPLCFAGDTILPSTRLDGVREGEVLFLQHAGAYLEAVANRFNGRRSAGLVVLDQEGIHRATRPEEPFFSPPWQTYDWNESNAARSDSKEFGVEEIEALRSRYFSEHAEGDRYEILSFSRSNAGCFTFEAFPRCGVDFISVPLAMRIAADAVIIAVIAAMGKRVKDVSVWGSKGTFQYREPIQPGKRISGTVSLSPLAATIATKQRMVATVTLDGERFWMSSEVVV